VAVFRIRQITDIFKGLWTITNLMLVGRLFEVHTFSTNKFSSCLNSKFLLFHILWVLNVSAL